MKCTFTTIEVIPCWVWTDVRVLQCCQSVWYLHAIHSSKATFQVQENDVNTCKNLEHLCALQGRINICQYFPLDRWLLGRKSLQLFQSAFLWSFLKNGNKDVFYSNFWQQGCVCEHKKSWPILGSCNITCPISFLLLYNTFWYDITR